jgi:hypothetical protein
MGFRPLLKTGRTSPDNIGKVYFNLGEISEDVLKMVETI